MARLLIFTALTFILWPEISAQDTEVPFSLNEQKNLSEDGLTINGFTRGSFYGFNKKYDFASVFAEFCMQGKYSHGRAYLYSDIRFRSGLFFDDYTSPLQIKEAYAGYSSDKFDAFLGNQIISWGRTDGFNPTNNITPNDYFFLSSEPDDQKMANFMLRTRYRLSQAIDIDLIGIPFYTPSVYRYDLFELGEYVRFNPAILPDRQFNKGSYAARVNVELPEIGFSLSWFRGYDPFHGYAVSGIDWSGSFPSIINTPVPYLKKTAGADFALPLNTWILRGEMAFNFTQHYDTAMYIPNPDFSYVLGIEHDFGGVNAIFQYVGKYTFNYRLLKKPVLENPGDPMAQMQYINELIYYEAEMFNRKIFYQQKKTNHALMMSLNKSFAYDLWNIEFTGYYNLTSEEYLLRPKISLKLTDALSLAVGGSYMDGSEKSVFSYSKPVLNGFFVEFKVSY
jgi:hypothetical protein